MMAMFMMFVFMVVFMTVFMAVFMVMVMSIGMVMTVVPLWASRANCFTITAIGYVPS